MRKLQISIGEILIGAAILAALFACYCYYFGTSPITVRPARNTSEPIIAIFKHISGMSHYGDYFQFGIWEDGTVIWRAGKDERSPKMLTTKVDPREINRLFLTLSRDRLLDPDMQRCHPSFTFGYYFAQIATTEGTVRLSSWNKDAKENYNFIYEGRMRYRYGPVPPAIKSWPLPYRRFIKNWDAVQAFAEGVKIENADSYDGPLPQVDPFFNR